MTNSAALEAIQNFPGRYPRQLWWLFFSEMWERFSFYGMRGMLILYMVDQLGMAEDVANLQYGATQAFVYAFTFVGGLFADKILGFRRSLLWGGALMVVSSVVLAVDPKAYFFVGIAFNIVGTGFFKPNISTMVGSLYREGDPRCNSGFSLFYAGINVGALLGGYFCVAIGKAYSWNVAFGLTAVVMTISVATFLYSQRWLGPIGLSPDDGRPDRASRRWRSWATWVGSLLAVPLLVVMVSKPQLTDAFMYVVGPVTLAYLLFEMAQLTHAERKKLAAALVFVLFSVVFWAFYEQSGGSLSLFAANNLDHTVLGIQLDPNGVNNAANSVFIIALSPLFGLLWPFLATRGLEPSTAMKFALGFLLLAGSFAIFYALRFLADPQGITSLDVFTAANLVMTLGELCLSPIGLASMTKLSPIRLRGVVMGTWFLASAYGQYVAGLLGAGMTSPEPQATAVDKLLSYTEGYRQLALYGLGAAVLLVALTPVLTRLAGEVKAPPVPAS